MASNKFFLYFGVILAIIGIILIAAGTTTVTYPSEVYDINGMTLAGYFNTPNYFWNFLGLAILLFGAGSLMSYAELRRKEGNKK
ncbi:hypothetical protein [Sulfolobus sp. E11-6]|uniref:hypothetical protein n=1 Tax=Sulfolobus sp. E11-6 TaxID=2663020 RepID=UPI0012976671|nr:hypothetical protein [Sulfolobus sp. E11-6]QGA69228.1 hypothetical protein GFS33_11430 [Sulfolobus sp. E11-6]